MKRIISILLTVILIITAVPFEAFAKEAEIEVFEIIGAEEIEAEAEEIEAGRARAR